MCVCVGLCVHACVRGHIDMVEFFVIHSRSLNIFRSTETNISLQEEGPKVDKSKKRLNSARLDMDTAKSR